MGFLDRAKEAAQRAKSQARVAREQGQQRLSELQARRQAELLLREVGIAAYEEHRGEADHEAVVRALARLDAHLRNHPSDLSTGGLRAYMRTAAGSGDAEGPRAGSPDTEQGAEPDSASTPPAADAAEASEEPAPPPRDDGDPEEPAEEPEPPADGPPAEPAAKKTAKKATKKSTAKKAPAKKTAKKAPAKKAAKKTAEKPPPADEQPSEQAGPQPSE